MIETAIGNINAIYKQIKQHEISPDTDYLFSSSGYSGDKNGDLERTIKRLEALNSMNTITRNRPENDSEPPPPPPPPPPQTPTAPKKYSPYE
jgi:hypothetical protein